MSKLCVCNYTRCFIGRLVFLIKSNHTKLRFIYEKDNIFIVKVGCGMIISVARLLFPTFFLFLPLVEIVCFSEEQMCGGLCLTKQLKRYEESLCNNSLSVSYALVWHSG